MKKNLWRGLQLKIIGWSFVPAVIILSGVAWFTFYSYQKVIGDLAIKQDREIVRPKAVQIWQSVVGLVNPVILPIFADIDKDHEAPPEVRAQRILDQTTGLEVFDGGIYFLDKHGIIYKTSPENAMMIGQDWSNSPHFRFLSSQWNSAAFTDLIPMGSSNVQILCSGIAMTDKELVTVGAVYLCFQIYPVTENAYYQRLNSSNLDPNIFLLDRNYRIIYSQNPADIIRDLSGEAYIQKLSQAEVKSGRFKIGSEEMVVSYVPLAAPSATDAVGWAVLKQQSWREIMQPTLAYRQLLLVLLALGVVVPALVTAYGVRHITGPIQKLIQATEQVMAGKFKQQIEVKTGDEIETLADQFNLMSAKLDDLYSSLEKKVADRTRELAIMNSIISVASQSLDIQEILEDALDKTVEQMGFESGAAFKVDSQTNKPVLVAQCGFEPAISEESAEIGSVGKLTEEDERQPMVTICKLEDIKDEKWRGLLSQSNYQSVVCVPLTTKGLILGFFLLCKRDLEVLSPEELSLLDSIGKQIGVAMENAKLYEAAEQTAIAAERNRLARELHDAVTQTLFSASLIADVTPSIWKRDPEDGMRNLEELRQLTRGALAEMRTLLLEMRPESLERPDLRTLLTQLVDAFIGRVRVPVSMEIEGADCELPKEVKIVFYRVAQEALNNIAKHAGARQVTLSLQCNPDHLNLSIKDDGLGFDIGTIPPSHLGIGIMRERAGSIGARFSIESQIGLGTIVDLDWKPRWRE